MSLFAEHNILRDSFLLLVLTLLPVQSLTFIQQPSTKYVFINTTVEFECICKGCEVTYWRVNGKSPSYWADQGREIETSKNVMSSNKSYTLTVLAVAYFNDSNITCTIHHSGKQLTLRSHAKLYIQDVVPSVLNLSVLQYNSTTLEVTFSAPFAIHESVSVDYYIIELEENRKAKKPPHKMNITSTVVVFSDVHYCSDYNVLVTPYNALGAGEVNIKDGIIIYGEADTYSFVTINSEIVKYYFNAWIQFQTNKSCVGTIPRSFDIVISCEDQDCPSTNIGSCSLNILNESFFNQNENCSSIVTVTDISETIAEVKINISDYISQGHHYKINVVLVTASLPWISPNTSMLSLSTFHTTAAEITSFSSNRVCIKCSLRSDSPERGCLAIFHNHMSEKELTAVVNRIPGENVAYTCFERLPDGVYQVSVTDIMNYRDGLVNNQHVFVQKDNFTISHAISVTYASFQLLQSTESAPGNATTSHNAGLSSNSTAAGSDDGDHTVLLSAITGSVITGLILCNITTLIICTIKTRRRKSFVAMYTDDSAEYTTVTEPCGGWAHNEGKNKNSIYEDLKQPCSSLALGRTASDKEKTSVYESLKPPDVTVTLNRAYEATRQQQHYDEITGVSYSEVTNL